MIATAHDAVHIAVVLLALGGFGLAVWLAYIGRIVPAIVVAAIVLVAAVALWGA